MLLVPFFANRSAYDALPLPVDPLDTSDFYAPFADAGSGAVNLTLTRGSGSATFTRATAAATRLSDGTWKLDVASGTARSYYMADATYAGYLAERATTNRCLWNRDFTDAAWVHVNVTAAKDATGIDGSANACSTLTSGAIGGTSLQTITSANANRVLSAFVKRKTGTGTVNITLDGGVSSTDISGLINSTTFTRVSRTQTVANPVIGFSFGASGDEIIVDCMQEQTDIAAGGGEYTAPIVTTSAAVTKNVDVLSYTSANVNDDAGTCYVEAHELVGTITTGATKYADGGDAAAGLFLGRQTTNAMTTNYMDDGPNIVQKTGLTNLTTGVRKRASRWGSSTMSVTGDGATVATGTFDNAMTATSLRVSDTTNSNNHSSAVKELHILLTDEGDAVIEEITA